MPVRKVRNRDKFHGHAKVPDMSGGKGKAGRRGPGQPLHSRRYPWDEWFSRPNFTLKKERDYNGRTYTFVQQVRNRAHERGVPIKIEVDEDELGFTCFVGGGGVGISASGGGMETAAGYEK